ncbi:hypothetical protein K2173_008174 [Erythroxylum novogranatense]|uniref:Transcription repressor n=1 Tax=Erythroxylum novogranatense TaxID=1862640 RepID=A0AAV8U8V5_9ROSI|nr:hypothetical protein K2173_008174 [Erythroxylum novogranatense]
MGNYKFKLSDIMPNAWFYKIKNMSNGRTRKQSGTNKKQHSAQPLKPKQPHQSCPRKSYYYTRELIPTELRYEDPKAPDPPRNSSKRRIKQRSLRSPDLVSSSVSAGCSCPSRLCTKPEYPSHNFADSYTSPELLHSFPPEFRSDHVLTTKDPSFPGCNFDSNVEDVVIDVDKKSLESRKFSKQSALFDKKSDLDLPPIIPKPIKVDEKVENIKRKHTKQMNSCRRNSFSVEEEKVSVKEQKKRHSGVKIRVNSPKFGSRKIQGRKSMSISSRSLSDSLAIVKSSQDPQRDFRESMVEMILENNIKASKDLEDLLACYLSLNSDEYHDLIIKVFKQIWFDLTNIHTN